MVPFQSIGSRGSPVSTLIVRPMTSLGTDGLSGEVLQQCDLLVGEWANFLTIDG